MNIAALILAAGSSSRMGVPKQLLQLGDKTLIQLCCETALKTNCSSVYCVIGADALKVKENIASYEVKIVENTAYHKGLSSSLKTGIAFVETKHFDAVLILLADQPKISADQLNSLIDLFLKQPDRAVASLYKNGLGVPAVFPKKDFHHLKSLSGDKGAKALLAQNAAQIQSIPFDDLIDIDTIEDYHNLLKDA